MFKVSIALVACALVGFAQAGLRDDNCGRGDITFDGIYGRIQCNYKDRVSQHYKYESGVHSFWAYTDDEPHFIRAYGRNPRTEMSFDK